MHERQGSGSEVTTDILIGRCEELRFVHNSDWSEIIRSIRSPYSAHSQQLYDYSQETVAASWSHRYLCPRKS